MPSLTLSSQFRSKRVEGLRCVRVLAQHHQETLMDRLHEVCLAVAEEVPKTFSSPSLL